MAEIPQHIEKEIAELERALAEKRAVLQSKHEEGEIEEMPHPKEILREVMKERIAATPGAAPVSFQPPAQATPSTPPPAGPSSYASSELKPKVDELVRLAFEKSLDEAIKLAKATENAALIDAFHDVMVDELYDHLIAEGKLEQVT